MNDRRERQKERLRIEMGIFLRAQVKEPDVMNTISGGKQPAIRKIRSLLSQIFCDNEFNDKHYSYICDMVQSAATCFDLDFDPDAEYVGLEKQYAKMMTMFQKRMWTTEDSAMPRSNINSAILDLVQNIERSVAFEGYQAHLLYMTIAGFYSAFDSLQVVCDNENVALSDGMSLSLANRAVVQVENLCSNIWLWEHVRTEDSIKVYCRNSDVICISEKMYLFEMSIACNKRTVEDSILPWMKACKQWSGIDCEVLEWSAETENSSDDGHVLLVGQSSQRDASKKRQLFVNLMKVKCNSLQTLIGFTGASHPNYVESSDSVLSHFYVGGYMIVTPKFAAQTTKLFYLQNVSAGITAGLKEMKMTEMANVDWTVQSLKRLKNHLL